MMQGCFYLFQQIGFPNEAGNQVEGQCDSCACSSSFIQSQDEIVVRFSLFDGLDDNVLCIDLHKCRIWRDKVSVQCALDDSQGNIQFVTCMRDVANDLVACMGIERVSKLMMRLVGLGIWVTWAAQ